MTVWPASSRLFDLDSVIVSYERAATGTGAMLCPAGLAWKYAWELKPVLPLYGSDGMHPSPMDTLLAAITIYGTITQEADYNFLKLEELESSYQIGKDDFKILKDAAIKALHL